jgi:transcriptional regulator with XRE-family HTH domain
MNSTNERESFSERLQQALKNAHYSPDSPTRLAREFNIRFEGRPITVHAARKWLVGEAIPTQEKLRMIAQWLGVPADWLRFGGSETPGGNGEGRRLGAFRIGRRQADRRPAAPGRASQAAGARVHPHAGAHEPPAEVRPEVRRPGPSPAGPCVFSYKFFFKRTAQIAESRA